jgi:hypothetical protein
MGMTLRKLEIHVHSWIILRRVKGECRGMINICSKSYVTQILKKIQINILTRLSSSVVIVSFPCLPSSLCNIKSICLHAKRKLDLIFNQRMIHISSSSASFCVLGENKTLNFLFSLGSISNPGSISPQEHFFFLPDFYSFFSDKR